MLGETAVTIFSVTNLQEHWPFLLRSLHRQPNWETHTGLVRFCRPPFFLTSGSSELQSQFAIGVPEWFSLTSQWSAVFSLYCLVLAQVAWNLNQGHTKTKHQVLSTPLAHGKPKRWRCSICSIKLGPTFKVSHEIMPGYQQEAAELL